MSAENYKSNKERLEKMIFTDDVDKQEEEEESIAPDYNEIPEEHQGILADQRSIVVLQVFCDQVFLQLNGHYKDPTWIASYCENDNILSLTLARLIIDYDFYAWLLEVEPDTSEHGELHSWLMEDYDKFKPIIQSVITNLAEGENFWEKFFPYIVDVYKEVTQKLRGEDTFNLYKYMNYDFKWNQHIADEFFSDLNYFTLGFKYSDLVAIYAMFEKFVAYNKIKDYPSWDELVKQFGSVKFTGDIIEGVTVNYGNQQAIKYLFEHFDNFREEVRTVYKNLTNMILHILTKMLNYIQSL